MKYIKFQLTVFAFLFLVQWISAQNAEKDTIRENLNKALQSVREYACDQKSDPGFLANSPLAEQLPAVICGSSSTISAHTYLETLRVLEKMEKDSCTSTADLDFLQLVIDSWYNGKPGLPIEKLRQEKELSTESYNALKQQIQGEWLLEAPGGTLNLPNFAPYNMLTPIVFHPGKEGSSPQTDATGNDSYRMKLENNNRFSILLKSATNPISIEIKGDWNLTNDKLTFICDTYNYYYPTGVQENKLETAPMPVWVDVSNGALTFSPFFDPEQVYNFLWTLFSQCEKRDANAPFAGLDHYFTMICGASSSSLSAWQFTCTQNAIVALLNNNCKDVKGTFQQISETLQSWRRGFYDNNTKKPFVQWNKGDLPIGTIRILLLCLIPMGALFLFFGIRGLRKLFFGEVILEMPFNDQSATFTIQTPGKYAIWQKGTLYRRVPVDKFKPEISDESTGKMITIYKSWANVHVTSFRTGRGLMFTFSIQEKGEYRLELVPGSSLLKVVEILNTATNNVINLKEIDLKEYYIQIRQSQALWKSMLCLPLILLGAFCVIGGIVLTALADQMFV